MPEQIFKKLKNNILPQWKICFVSALVMGLIAHFYKITNWLPNWDSLVFRYDAQNMLALGRWFLPVVCAPSSFYDLPWLAGLLAILFHGAGAVCICKMFGVKKNTTAALIGALTATFPTVTSVMMYNYVADGYAFAFLLSAMAAMFLTCKKPKYIISVILITLSVGIYQAYITVTIMLLLCYLITENVKKKTKSKDLLLKTVKFFATGAAGMGLYYIVFNVLLKITGTVPLDYQGFGNASLLSSIDIWGALYTVKNTFLIYFFDFSKGCNAYSIINIDVLVLTVILYGAEVVKNKLSINKILLLLLYIVLLPIGANVLAFINSSIDYHNLMKMGYCVFYLLFILHYEKTDYKNAKLNSIKQWSVICLAFVLVFNYVVIANVSYHKLNMAYEKSYGTLIRIADRIEQTEGAENCDSILVIGALDNSEAYSVNLPPDITGTTDGYILRADDEVVRQSVLCSALNDYCDKNYRFLAGSEKEDLLASIDDENMNIWPKKDSVIVVDNVIVVKLSNQEVD
ncbi:MAG: glucosyltransferase domain-containing protein [Clostridia bacterium]|nr:glucosyltransferase domain-containing protein [Clostridia bacterium]